MVTNYQFDTSPERSSLMKKIRSRDTGPEKTLRNALTKLGYRYRLHSTKLPGKPDLVLNRYKLAVFIDGEFWHGFDWQNKQPKIKANREYWIPKIERTIARDLENTKKLEELGFIVFRFWERDIRQNLDDCLAKIEKHCQSAIP